MNRLLALFSGSLALALAGQALAGTLTLTNGTPGGAYGGSGGGYFVGLIPMTFVDGAISKSFFGYCIDRELHSNWNDPYSATESLYSGPVPGETGQIAYLANAYGYDAVTASGGGGTTDAVAAQMAIWIIRTGKTGNWISNWGLGGYESRADALILESQQPSAANYVATRYTTGGSPDPQDFVTANSVPFNTQTVPEPFTMALGAAGIAVFAKRRKKS